ncbi:hypothetical protein EVAR_85939_1 [Eumeta japonica]|uniref:Uncharacterized protein n=1 Tax=Eumeta variegata TaxID=151549 RepID=A0A4C2A8P5_EUMVA|nr:hypothetical protein EVAR_85939_1 [Eumeta japonica]
MEAIQNKMRSRKEIKVEAAKRRTPAHHERVMAYHKDADIIENVLAQNKHLVKDINKESDDTGQIQEEGTQPTTVPPVLELSPVSTKDS